MTEQQVKDFFQAVATTDWNMDFPSFCKKTGFVGFYAEESWHKWRTLVVACEYFDEKTLMKILG